jgi:hypothetical protein
VLCHACNRKTAVKNRDLLKAFYDFVEIQKKGRRYIVKEDSIGLNCKSNGTKTENTDGVLIRSSRPVTFFLRRHYYTKPLYGSQTSRPKIILPGRNHQPFHSPAVVRRCVLSNRTSPAVATRAGSNLLG